MVIVIGMSCSGLLDLFTQEELDSNLAAAASECVKGGKGSAVDGFDDPQWDAWSDGRALEGLGAGGTINAMPTSKPSSGPDENAPPAGHMQAVFFADSGREIHGMAGQVQQLHHEAPHAGLASHHAFANQSTGWDPRQFPGGAMSLGPEGVGAYEAGGQWAAAHEGHTPLHHVSVPPAGGHMQVGAPHMPAGAPWTHLHLSQQQQQQQHMQHMQHMQQQQLVQQQHAMMQKQQQQQQQELLQHQQLIAAQQQQHIQHGPPG